MIGIVCAFFHTEGKGFYSNGLTEFITIKKSGYTKINARINTITNIMVFCFFAHYINSSSFFLEKYI